ncbi:MAG: hypothetical protein FJ116_06125 [Deltaproteobacteria bacterium]|nr:hypothetical protein [Deltaproteobacteria bacterium]
MDFSWSETVFDSIDLWWEQKNISKTNPLIDLALQLGRTTAKNAPVFWPITLSLGIYGSLKREMTDALPLSRAATLFFLGIDIVDNVFDEEIPNALLPFSSPQVSLTGMTLLSPMTHMALEDLGSSPHANKIRLLFSEAVCRISMGQFSDLSSRPDILWSPLQSLQVSLQKGGIQGELYATIAALWAGASDSVAEKCGTFGRYLSTAGQIQSDISDIMRGELGNDLKNGKQTLPVSYALKTANSEEKQKLIEMLREASNQSSIVPELKRVIIRSGGIRYAAFCAQLLIAKAQDAISHALDAQACHDLLSDAIFHLSRKGDKDENTVMRPIEKTAVLKKGVTTCKT